MEAAPDALALLRRVFWRVPFPPLITTIEQIARVRPQLTFVERRAAGNPGPELRGMFDGDSLFERRTGYQIGPHQVSYHQAFVAPARLDRQTRTNLASGQLTLAEFFADPRCSKTDFVFGDHSEPGLAGSDIELFGPQSDRLRPWIGRRYSVTMDGVVVFHIAELLPLQVWNRVLSSGTQPVADARRRSKALARHS